MAKHLTKKQSEELSAKHLGSKARRDEGIRNMHYSFLIVSEGTKTEPEYFKHFTSRRSRIQIIGADRSTMKLVKESLKIRDLDTFDFRWLVFDRDDNTDFNEAISFAEKNGFHCAWSNESFELWFCLYFVTLDTAIGRKRYIDILEHQIRQYIPDFSYSKSGDVMFDILSKYGNKSAAKERAKKLRELYVGSNYAAHNPCTRVDLLVEELEKYGRE